MAQLKMPANLSAEGKALWKSIVPLHDLGPVAARLLVDACREADHIQRLEVEMAAAELLVRGAGGQPVQNPLSSELRQHRAVLSGLLKALQLPAAAGDAKRAEQVVTEQARKAARARWDKPRLVG
jgi:hypothetical protein